MKIINPQIELIGLTSLIGDDSLESPMRLLELAIRNCYKSEVLITEDSWKKIINIVLQNSHTSTLEHVNFTFRVITSRDVLQDLVRHRIASYSVESTRYCNYSKDKKGMVFIRPAFLMDKINFDDMVFENYSLSTIAQSIKDVAKVELTADETLGICEYFYCLTEAEERYNKLIESGWKPQEARITLPGNLKTEIVMTMNIRSLLNFLTLRTANAAHPDFRIIAKMIGNKLNEMYPLIFPINHEI